MAWTVAIEEDDHLNRDIVNEIQRRRKAKTHNDVIRPALLAYYAAELTAMREVFGVAREQQNVARDEYSA